MSQPHFSIVVTEGPAEEPLSLAEAKLHLRVGNPELSPDIHPDDTLIETLIISARETCEAFTQSALVTQTIELRLDCFPHGEMLLPRSPVQHVNSVKYIDGAGALQTWDSALYQVDTRSKPARIRPMPGVSWPSIKAGMMAAVTVEYVAGYGEREDIPKPLLSGMKLLLGHLYENREASVVGTIVAELPMGVEPAWWPHRIVRFQ